MVTTVPRVVGEVQRVLMVGAGGHARVCLEALLDDAATEVVGTVSGDGSGIAGLGVPVLGLDGDLVEIAASQGVSSVFVAIGDNAARSTVTARCEAAGLTTVVALSRFAMVSRSAELRHGSAVLPGAVINAASAIGRGTIINTNASVDHDCDIGDFVHIAPGVAICGGVSVGAGTLIGVGARVLPNIKIGARAVVGAGAVVVNDVADGMMVTGVPARARTRSGK